MRHMIRRQILFIFSNKQAERFIEYLDERQFRIFAEIDDWNNFFDAPSNVPSSSSIKLPPFFNFKSDKNTIKENKQPIRKLPSLYGLSKSVGTFHYCGSDSEFNLTDFNSSIKAERETILSTVQKCTLKDVLATEQMVSYLIITTLRLEADVFT